jgi:hypothetical protein
LLKRFDAWLGEHDRDSKLSQSEDDPAEEGDHVRAGIGIYYFEEDVS